MIVATAGHIDHGKTTLVKALTGVDTDRLPQEKARGISIDLGFAYWKTSAGDTIGFVDVPGHERFVRNMLAGVCAIDFALLVVAADDGVMPQTREHLHIIDLLGIRQGLALITKADRATAQRLEEVRAEVALLLAGTSLAGASVMAVSAATGDGIPALRTALADAARTQQRTSADGRHPRCVLDRSFTIAGSGTVVTGTVVDGTIRSGDKLCLSPSGREVRVRGLQQDGVAVGVARAGERCAINLAGVERSDVERGDWLLHPRLHAPTSRLDVDLKVLADEPHALRHWTPVHLHIGTRDVTARVALRRGESIEPGERAFAQLVTDQPVAALHGDRFILRDQSARRTLAGGAVLDPWPAQRRPAAAQRTARLAALLAAEADEALAALLAVCPGGVVLEDFARNFNLDSQATEQVLQRAKVATVGAGAAAMLLPTDALAATEARVQRSLEQFHRAQPLAATQTVAALRAEAAPQLAAPVFQDLLRRLADAGIVQVSTAGVRLKHHVASANAEHLRLWQLAEPVLRRAGRAGLTVAQLAEAVRGKEAVVRDMLHSQVQAGATVRVNAERFYLRSTMDDFIGVAREVALASPGGRFTAGRFRDGAGIGRALAVEVLEALDRLGATQRIADARVLRPPPASPSSYPGDSRP